MMKILMLANKMPYPPRDGGAIGILSLALAMEKVGNEVSILTMNTSKHYFDCSSIPKEISSKINIYSTSINIDIKLGKAISNLLFSKIPYNAERFISEDYNNKLIDLLNNNNYDVIQVEGIYLCPYIDTIRKHSNAKITLRSHNIEYEIWERTAANESNILKKLYIKNLANRLKKYELEYLNKYDFLVPVTKRDGEIYNSLGNIRPLHVAETGIDKDRYIQSNKVSEYPGFFHIGALDWIPNQEGLLWFINNVWIKFVKNCPDAKFYLAGRNAPAKFIKNIQAVDSIIFLGEISNANEFINSKSIMIVPLLSGSGMRVKIIEGMALGKTIITTTMGTEGINTTNEENILIADTPEKFCEYLELVYNNKELHNKISENASDFINKYYNNYNIAARLIEFYKNNINN